jgi:LuxR family maltose regulon positive regulatory protein
MSRKPPQVRDAWLLNPEVDGGDVRLDTPAWFAWLERAKTRSFAYGLVDPAQGCIVGLMTVRKERRQRGGWYWSVYRRQGSQLRRFYLGCSCQVTQTRLHQIAQQLLTEAAKEREHLK